MFLKNGQVIIVIKIAICDDEQYFLERIEKMLQLYGKKTGQQLYIKKFTQSIHLMDSLNEEFQIYFLDLQMPIMDGFELAQIIRRFDDRSTIIFVTSYREYVFDSFQFDIANYITKPLTQIQVDCEMNRAIRKLNTYEQAYLAVKNNNGFIKLFLSDIQYIETYERNVLIHCQDDRNEIGHFKMQELEERLKDYPFTRCHNSYIVNVDYIKQIHDLSVTLLSGEKIYTTKSRKKELIKKMAERTGCV